jgi:hypothetical protein
MGSHCATALTALKIAMLAPMPSVRVWQGSRQAGFIPFKLHL